MCVPSKWYWVWFLVWNKSPIIWISSFDSVIPCFMISPPSVCNSFIKWLFSVISALMWSTVGCCWLRLASTLHHWKVALAEYHYYYYEFISSFAFRVHESKHFRHVWTIICTIYPKHLLERTKPPTSLLLMIDQSACMRWSINFDSKPSENKHLMGSIKMDY